MFQVDALWLDVEMSAMLKEQLLKVFSLMEIGLTRLNYLTNEDHYFLIFEFESVLVLLIGSSQECYFNMNRNLLFFLSSSFGDFQFGSASLLWGMLS